VGSTGKFLKGCVGAAFLFGRESLSIPRRFRLPLLLSWILGGIACGDVRPFMARLTPPEDDRVAREFLAAARANDSAKIFQLSAPATRDIPDFRDTVSAVFAHLPAGVVDTIRQVGVNINISQKGRVSSLTYEVHTGAGWGLANFDVRGDDKMRRVFGFHVSRIDSSLEEQNGFQAGARHPVRVLVLALAIGVAAFCIWVAVAAVRSRIKRRWLWALFALLGVAPFVLNWSTGDVAFRLLQVLILSAGFEGSPPFGPWLVSVAFPVGAIATLYRIRGGQPTPEDVAPPSVEPTAITS